MKRIEGLQKTLFIMTVFSISIAITSIAYPDAIIIDHTCTDISQIPEYWINQAKDMFKLSYGHTSHGSQIVTGMLTMNSDLGCSCSSCGDSGCTSCTYGFCDDYYYYKYRGANPVAPAGVLSFWDGKPEGASDLGNPDRTAWEAATRAMLEDPNYDNRNVVMWSWCGQADTTEENIQIYLDLMSGVEADYPEVTFIYMTGHLNGTGETGNLHQRNNQIRSHVMAHNGVLFDFADIESYDPDGDYFLDRGADDGCNYDGGNWADEWCADHPGDALCTSCSCAHSRPLNCNLKGRAFWWMMARLAGWDSGASTSTTTINPIDADGDGVIDSEDNCVMIPNGSFLGTCAEVVGDIVKGTGVTCTLAGGCESAETCQMNQEDCNDNGIGDACECYADFDSDGNVYPSDLTVFLGEYGRTDCTTTPPPCVADFDGDGNVYPGDLSVFLEEYGREDCPTVL